MRDAPETDTDGVSMIIIGGPGDDMIEGRGGDDYLDGDAQLVVQLVDTTTGQRFDRASQLQAAVFAGTLNPGDIDIVREIVLDLDAANSLDTSVYTNPMATYTITALPNGYWQIAHTGAEEAEEGDGSDVIRGFERLQFSDGCAALNDAGDAWESCQIGASVVLSTDTPAEDVPVVATLMQVDGVTPIDASSFSDFEFVWWGGEGEGAGEISEWEELGRTGAGGGTGVTVTSNYTPGDADVDMFLRATVSYTDAAGQRQVIVSETTTGAVIGENDLPTGPTITYQGAPAAPTDGQLLTSTPVLDGDGLEDVVFTYTWTRSTDPTVPDGSEVLGSTSNVYTTVAGDIGYYIRVTVTYTDILGTAETATAVLSTAVISSTPVVVPAP